METDLGGLPELTIEDIIAAAHGNVEDPAALCLQRVEERLRNEPNPLRLVSRPTFAALMGTSISSISQAHMRNHDGFPVAVFKLHGEPGFYDPDVYEFRARGRAPRRRENEFADKAMGSPELATTIGVHPKRIWTNMQAERWHLVPRPDGRYGTSNYWLRDHVKQWQEARADKAR